MTFSVKVEEHLAVRRCLEIVGLLKSCAQFLMIVDFTVYSENVAIEAVN